MLPDLLGVVPPELAGYARVPREVAEVVEPAVRVLRSVPGVAEEEDDVRTIARQVLIDRVVEVALGRAHRLRGAERQRGRRAQAILIEGLEDPQVGEPGRPPNSAVVHQGESRLDAVGKTVQAAARRRVTPDRRHALAER
jgi:hypothetical protein